MKTKQQKDEELMKTINLISSAIEKTKQKAIKRIIKRLDRMSNDDVQTLKRIINA